MGLLGLTLPEVPDPIPAIDFRQAQRLIAAATGERLEGEPDLAPAHESWLGEWARREHGSDFLYVTGFPMAKRPFSTQPAPGDPERSNSFDLLYRGQELVRAASGCTATTTTSRRSRRAAWIRRRSRATWRRSGTGCRPTAASAWAWSGGCRAWSGPPTSARWSCSRET